jgi:hypothetical protein
VQPLILPLVLAILGCLSGVLNGAAVHFAAQMQPCPEILQKSGNAGRPARLFIITQ